jgi:hypothetical protein
MTFDGGSRVKTVLAVIAVLTLLGCSEDKKAESRRFELKKISDSTFEILPTTSQLPYCLAFTTSEKGITRQLTMTHENKSLRCEPGQPIAGLRFRAPVDEGQIKVHVLFSDQKLSAASVGQQMFELASGGKAISVMDLRLPGHVQTETQEFKPEEEKAAALGTVIGGGGEVDAGSDAVDAGL